MGRSFLVGLWNCWAVRWPCSGGWRREPCCRREMIWGSGAEVGRWGRIWGGARRPGRGGGARTAPEETGATRRVRPSLQSRLHLGRPVTAVRPACGARTAVPLGSWAPPLPPGVRDLLPRGTVSAEGRRTERLAGGQQESCYRLAAELAEGANLAALALALLTLAWPCLSGSLRFNEQTAAVARLRVNPQVGRTCRSQLDR